MRISPQALFQASCIDCVKTQYDAERQDVISHPARLVFVTPENAERARAVDRGLKSDVTRMPDLKFGDMLVHVRPQEGVSRIEVIPAGRDAAVSLTLPDGAILPITGHSMLSAVQRLNMLQAAGQALPPAYEMARRAIRTVFQMICANPDPERYDPVLVAHAFISHLVDHPGPFRLAMEPEAFAARMRADLARARISRLDPDHPDGIRHAYGDTQILRRCGIDPESGTGFRSANGPVLAAEGMRRMILGNDRIRREVLEMITVTPVDRFGISVLSADQAEDFLQANDEAVLTGAWVDVLRTRLREEISRMLPDHRFEIDLLSLDGRDFLAVRDQADGGPGPARGQACLFSWLTRERVQTMTVGEVTYLNFSPEENPGALEIIRLQSVLDDLVLGREMADLPESDCGRSRQSA